MAIRIKRSTGSTAPATLASGQLAYVEGTGKLYFGYSNGNVTEIGGNADHTKLAGIESGAQVNTVTSVAGRTGAVTIASTDVTDFSTAVGNIIGGASINALSDVSINSPADGQQLTYDGILGQWVAGAPGTGVTSFTQLNDVPNSYSGKGLHWVRVNTGGTALEFTQDVDDGSF